MSEISIGEIVGRLKIDLSAWTQGLQQARAQLQALQQQTQQLSQSLGASTFQQATSAMAAFQQSIAAGTAAMSRFTASAQAGTQQTASNTASTNALASAYLAMAQSIQQQTQAYTQAQAAVLAYRQQQDALREATRQAAAEASRAGDIWKQAFAVAAGIGLVTSLHGVASAVKDFVSESLTGFAQFETGVIKVGTLIEGFQGKGAQFDAMAKQIHDWAILSGKSTADISHSLFELVSAFGSVEKASVIMVQALRMAEGGQTTVSIAGKALSTIMLGLGQDLSKTADVANAMAKAAQQNRQDLGAFASAIAPAIPALAVARLSLQNYGAAMSILTTQGRTSSEAVTGLNQVLLNLFAPTMRADKTLRDLAAAMGAPRLEAKKFQDGTLDLLTTLKQFEGMDLQVMRRALGGNSQALLTLEALILAHEQLKTRMEDANRSSQTLTQEQQLSAGMVSQAWNKVGEASKAFKDTLGELVGQNPAVTSMLTTLKQSFIELTANVELNRTALGALITTFAEFGTRAIGILKAVGQTAIWVSAQLGTMTAAIARTALEAQAQEQVRVNPRFQSQSGGGGDVPAPQFAGPNGEQFATAPIVSPPRPAPTITMDRLMAGATAANAAKDAAREALRAAKEAERELARDDAERLAQVMATGKEYIRAIESEMAANDRAIESLRHLAAQYGMSKPARDADTASLAAASLASSVYTDEANRLNAAIQDSTTMLDKVPGLLREAASSYLVYVEAQKAAAAQTDFDKKLADQLRVLQVPRDERVAVRMRNQAPDGVATPEQDRTIQQIAAQERLNHAVRIFEELASPVAQAWQGVFAAIFAPAQQNADPWHLQVVTDQLDAARGRLAQLQVSQAHLPKQLSLEQEKFSQQARRSAEDAVTGLKQQQEELQKTVSLAERVGAAFKAMAQAILQSMARIAAEEGTRALIRFGAGMLTGALTSGIAPATSQYASPIGPTEGGSGFLGGGGEAGFVDLGFHAGGGIVNRPQLAMLGEDPSMNPEVILNKFQLQGLVSSAMKAGPSAGGQAAGGSPIAIINVASQEDADQQASKYRSMGYEVTINHVMRELSAGEGSQILGRLRKVQR